MVDRLVAMTVAERLALPWLHPGRADVIAAGALILSRVLRRTTVEHLVVSEADILDGIAALVGKKQVSQAFPPAPEKAIAGVKQDVEAVKGNH